MARTSLLLLVVVSVTIAGCSGVQNPGTPTAEPTGVPPDNSTVAPNQIPGVSDGTLTNATALATANGAGIVDGGATVRITRTNGDSEETALLTVAADGTAEFSRTMSAGDNESTVAYYANDSATYVRVDSGGETRYRVVEQAFRPLDGVNSSLETVLAAGNFTVANESTGSATVVLTADEFDAPLDDVLDDATPQRARLVVAADGGVRNLTLTGERDGAAVTYAYERRDAAVDRVPTPDWLADVPPTADLHADLTTDVVNDSYLRLDHDGGDTVPGNSTLRFTVNDTAGTVTFDAPFEAGDTRYAYFAASDGSLVVSDDRPAADATASFDSPASVTITTADGVTLLSAGMAWGSESVSAEAAADGGGNGSDA
ncbi:hypothetical protein [Haloarcula onubensis]|uniref:Uncharacterized protein n=1 Tax=Haloarcula onubensis TaxID=2950539 RepID=A0ABU2FPE6_9EURY|nr:hypothetical protein [Halomicroarcula sp. S3CR25-11]MDS0282620.1 hypothetical protein [Halomicroarcula sp. S3CR25-11]